MSKRVQDFLDAFAELEGAVQAKFDGSDRTPFKNKVKELAKADPLICRYEDEIKLFADLRNILVHRRIEGKQLAEPLPEVNRKLKRVTERLLCPPLMIDHFVAEIREFSERDTMKIVYSFLGDRDYSQVFLRNEAQQLTCLSARTMQRWVANHVKAGSVDLNTTIEEVLTYSENLEELSFVPRTATVLDAQQYFGNKDTPFQVAVIATETGKPTEKPLALVTGWDLGQIERIMSGDRK